MGGKCTSMNHKHNQKRYVVVCGLPASGKSSALTTLAKLHSGTDSARFKLTQLKVQDVKVAAFELEYEGNYKHHWPHQFVGAQGVVLVIDLQSDFQEELKMLTWIIKTLPTTPILVYLNKADLTSQDSVNAGLATVPEASLVKAFATSCVTKVGLEEGFSWLVSKMTSIT